MNASEIYNWVEVILWPSVGLACLIGTFCKQGKIPGQIWLLALAFAVFGLSDYIELQTGAWWKPWWLLAMKVGCTSAFILVGLSHYRSERARLNSEKADS